MKRFAILLLLNLALAGCDDNGGGQSYAAPQTYPTPVYGEPEIVDEAQLLADMCRKWPETFAELCTGEATY